MPLALGSQVRLGMALARGPRFHSNACITVHGSHQYAPGGYRGGCYRGAVQAEQGEEVEHGSLHSGCTRAIYHEGVSGALVWDD